MPEGRVIAGRYELAELLGRGGMGEVWAAWDNVIRRRVAVKLLQHESGLGTEEQLFLREAHTAGGLNHPGVVTVHDLGQDTDGSLYLIMELITGRDLGRVLRADGPPPVATAVDWAAQAAAALAVAHAEGIVHRDLKPGNLMVTEHGVVKILDFGIARFATTLTTASHIIGTPAYMPPERLLARPSDARGDLYSLGCLLHELLTGELPFGSHEPAALMFAHVHTEPEPPSRRRAEVPPELDRLVGELLAKSPDDRPATAGQVHDRLRALSLPPEQGAAGPSQTTPAPDIVTQTPPRTVGGPVSAPVSDAPPYGAAPGQDAVPGGPDGFGPPDFLGPIASAVPPPIGPPPARPVPPRGSLTRRRLLGIGAASVAVGAAGFTTYALSTGGEGKGGNPPGQAGQGGDPLDQLRTKGKVTIGVADEKPFGYIEDGEPTGEAPEIAKAIFKRLGISRVEGKAVGFDVLLPGLQAGTFDVIAASMYITPDRCKDVLFSDPDVQVKDAFLVKKGNAHGIKSYKDVAEKGLKVGTGTGYPQLDYAEEAGMQFLALPDEAAGLHALTSGRIDAFAGTRITLARAAKGEPSVEVTEAFWPVIDDKPVYSAGGFAFHRSAPQLRDAFNAELLKMRKSGELLRIARPFGFTEDDMTKLTAEELC